MSRVSRGAVVMAFLAGILVACSPTPSPAPTAVPEPTPSPVASPPAAADACENAINQLRLAREVLLADVAPRTGIDPGIYVSEIPTHLAEGVRVVHDHGSCFSPETIAAWDEASETINTPSTDGIPAVGLRELFESLPTEPLG